MNHATAKKYGDKYLELFKPYCHKAEIAGSVRREKQDEIKDIEIVLLPKGKHLPEIWEIINKWHKVKGQTGGKYTQRITGDGITVDIFFTSENNWGFIYFIRTGSEKFSHNMAKKWVKAGYTGNNGFLTKASSGKIIPIKEEEDLFNLLEVKFVQPTER